MEDPFRGPVRPNHPLLHKALGPRPRDAEAELRRIQSLDLKGFSEADVREEVITPLIRLIGYAKGTVFSVDREKSIGVLEQHTFIDYNFTLWKENFWLIEAKKPRKKKFSHRDLLQAVQYAAHPEINAALIVLCDGNRIDVFDREVSLSKSVLHVTRGNLSRDFDKLRMLLDPWQVWFFEKRRVARLIDKVFDKEINFERLEEFRTLVDQHLSTKRSKVLDNFRANVDFAQDNEKRLAYLREASSAELVEIHFHLNDSWAAMAAVSSTLADRCQPSSFHVLHRVFPDRPRATTASFFAYALMLLIELEARGCKVNWLPTFLVPDSDEGGLNAAIQTLIRHCLTHFSSDRARKTILLFSASIRRLNKILMITRSDYRRLGDFLHAAERYLGPETSWSQVVSSPNRHLILELERAQIRATERFVADCSDDRERFLPNLSEVRLKELWAEELRLLRSVPNYRQLLTEHDLGETFPTEGNDVVYDNLGHHTLCVLDHFPRWKSFTLAQHKSEVELLAGIGSWQARKWLSIELEADLPRPSDQALAERFFLGDISTFRSIASLYGYITDIPRS